MSAHPYGCEHCGNQYTQAEYRRLVGKTCVTCRFGEVVLVRPNTLRRRRR
jgi:hypothetical protein